MLTYADDAVQVACGGDHTLVLLRNGSLYGFGKNANGQLGLPILDAENEATDYPWPVQLMSIPGEDDLEELGPVVAIACGLDSSYVTMQNGQVRAMGSSKYGQTGQGNQGNCQVPLQVAGLIGPHMRVAAGMYHALAVGCVNLINNKVRKAESALSLGWQRSEALEHQRLKFRQGKGPPVPNYSPELLGIQGKAFEWPLCADGEPLPADLDTGGGHDGFAGSRPYDAYTALQDEGDGSDESGGSGGREARDDEMTMPEECEWGPLLKASRIQRVRWLHGGVNDPQELTHTKLRQDDSFSEHLAKYEDSEDQRYAQALVTDFHDDPWRPPWWLRKNEMWGDDETDRTSFQSILHHDDYLEQPEHLKP